MSKAWQEQERLVAAWFGTTRNPLSGRNNVNDDGSRRLGDIVFPHALIEVKRHASVSLKIADETRALARQHGKPWVLYEFQTGRRDVVRLTMDADLAALVSDFICGTLTPARKCLDPELHEVRPCDCPQRR